MWVFQGFYFWSYHRLYCLGIALRWIATVVSGAVVFASYAPQGQNPWIYSMIYNATYMIPDGILNIIVLLFIYKGVKRGLGHRE